MRRLVVALLAPTLLAGCALIGDLPRAPEFPVDVPFEVWNRTQEDAFLVDLAGRRLAVPACGHAAIEQLRVNKVEVRTERGYVNAFGSGGGDLAGRRQYLVLVAADGESFPASERPVELPPCLGRPNAQPGV